jgi:hypothetical protein
MDIPPIDPGSRPVKTQYGWIPRSSGRGSHHPRWQALDNGVFGRKEPPRWLALDKGAFSGRNRASVMELRLMSVDKQHDKVPIDMAVVG